MRRLYHGIEGCALEELAGADEYAMTVQAGMAAGQTLCCLNTKNQWNEHKALHQKKHCSMYQ